MTVYHSTRDWLSATADDGSEAFTRVTSRMVQVASLVGNRAVEATGAARVHLILVWKNRRRAAGLKRIGRRAVPHALLGVSAILLCGLVVIGAAIAWTVATVPVGRSIMTKTSLAFEASNGQPLARRGAYVEHATYEEFPEILKSAVIAIEDRRFLYHHGIDLRGIGRAAVRNVVNGGYLEGASTITQQLVKLQWNDDSRTLGRKVREAIMAVWLDSRLGKREILTRYLNSVYFGKGTFGVSAAAHYYFGKPLDQITLQEAAMLAGTIKAPSRLNPLADATAAQARMELVLDAMVETGAITREAAASAAASPPTVVETRQGEIGPWFTDWVADEAGALVGNLNGPIHISTTMDVRLQKIAEDVLSSTLAEAGAEADASQAALVAMRPDGTVLAMVGGRDYDKSQFNRAVSAKRQPGSTFKLFVYLAALRAGYRPQDEIEDAPIEVRGWTPTNYDGDYQGWTTLENAFARSLNAATVKLALDVGLDNVIKAAHDLGITRPLAPNPSLALGSAELSLLDLTTAYAAVQGDRLGLKPRGVASFRPGDGPTLAVQSAKSGSGLGSDRAQLIRLLRRVVTNGTGRGAALDGFSAGKTGTSQDYRDAWFVGFDETITVGVWVGNDDNTPMKRVTGGGLPARIWKAFMTRAADGSPLIAQDTSDSRNGSRLQTVNVLSEDARSTSYEVLFESTDLESGMCNVNACAAAYRSFRASDCTYQPYNGSRRYCDRGQEEIETAPTYTVDRSYGRDESYRAPRAEQRSLPNIWTPVADERPARSAGSHVDMHRAWGLDR